MKKIILFSCFLFCTNKLLCQDTTSRIKGRVIHEPFELPVLKGGIKFTKVLRQRFLDTIPYLDSIAFKIYINKKGLATKVEMLGNLKDPQTFNSKDIFKLKQFIMKRLLWFPAYEITNFKKKYFGITIYE